MSAMASQITSMAIVYSPFIQAQTKENFKAPRNWPLWGNSPVVPDGPINKKASNGLDNGFASNRR